MLEQRNPLKRLELVCRLLTREIEILKLEGELQEQTQASITKNQHDYYLREQMRAIRTELGEEDEEDEIAQYRQKIDELHLAPEITEKLQKEDRPPVQTAGGLLGGFAHPWIPGCLPGAALECTDQGAGRCGCRPALFK